MNTLPKRTLSVAPMLDWTDRHYRHMARQITRHTWLYTEMVNAGAIVFGDPDRFLARNECENPVSLQRRQRTEPLGAGSPQSRRILL